VTGYLVRRTGWACVLLLVVTLYTFVLFFMIPSTPQVIGGARVTPEPLAGRYEFGLHGGVLQQYGQFLSHLARGDLGSSWTNRRPVADLIAEAAPATASLVIGGALVWLLIAFPIGIASALRPRSVIDRAGMVFVLIGISAHPLWIGYMLSFLLGYKFHWFPLTGYCDFAAPTGLCGGPVQWSYHLVLPWFTFAFAFAALYARMLRASVMETSGEDYVRTARAKGAGGWRVLRGHVLQNALLPIVTMLGMDISLAFAGSVFVERVYGIPGIGQLLYNSLARRDLPVILGIVVLVACAIVVFNVVVDLLYCVLDPRTRAPARPRAARLRARAGRRTARAKPLPQQ
jgi:peptide/nickel transport system permease protein